MATHAVYAEFVGPVPEGMMLLHSCDNGICVNPDHLRPGTHQDNMRDMTERKRSCIGQKHGLSKLTAEQVEAVRNDTRLQRVIAAEYGIKQPAVSRIKNGKRWKE